MITPLHPRIIWRHGIASIGNTIVGRVYYDEDFWWCALGCLEDWEDHELGWHNTMLQAKMRVIDFVKQHMEKT